MFAKTYHLPLWPSRFSPNVKGSFLIFQNTSSEIYCWSARPLFWLDLPIAPATRLNVLKDYLPQLLDNDQTKADSHYKRLIRFFRLATSNRLVICILQFIFRLFHSRFTHLILDATTWRVGKKPIHLLTLCILYRDTVIPIYWVQLSKKGHSSEIERQQLMTEALRYYRLQGKILLADREYIGENRTAEAVAQTTSSGWHRSGSPVRLLSGSVKAVIGWPSVQRPVRLTRS